MSKPRLYFLVSNNLHQDQRLHRICGSLSSHGYEVSLVGSGANADLYHSDLFSTTVLPRLFRRGFLFYLELNLRFFFFLLTKQLDGIVANDLDTILAARTLSILKRKKLFIDLHEYFTEVPELENKVVKKSIWNAIGKFGITRASHNYTVNRALAELFNTKYRCDFEYIYNYPLPFETQESNNDSKTFDLVYVGMVNKGRGIEETILAIKDLKDITLSVYGIGDEFDKIKQLVSSHELSDRVHLHGFIAGTSIRPKLPNYDLGINLITAKSLNYYYSSANKYFDYTMAGIPSLSMKFPEYIESNKKFETSLLIEKLEVPDIKAALIKLKNNPETIAKLKSNCELAKHEFNWTTQEPKLLSIYDSAFNL